MTTVSEQGIGLVRLALDTLDRVYVEIREIDGIQILRCITSLYVAI